MMRRLGFLSRGVRGASERIDNTIAKGVCMSPDRVIQFRAYVIWLIRFVAMVLFGAAGFWFVKRVIEGFFRLYYGGSWLECFNTAFGYSSRGSAGNTASKWIIAELVMAGILLLLAKRVSCWVVTMPANGCPGCGYPRPVAGTGEGSSTYCTECGLQGFLPSPPAPSTPSTAGKSRK